MSRIHEALKRLASGRGAGDGPEQEASTEPRVPVLERYPVEGPTAAKEADTRPVNVLHARERRESPRHRPGGMPVSARPAAPAPAVSAGEESPRPESSDDDAPIVDFGQLIDYVTFVGRSLRRRKLLAAAVFVLTAAVTIAAVQLLPRTYHVHARLLAQRSDVMAALGNPGRAIPPEAEAPWRAAAETVRRYDNLVALLRQTDMVNEWERTRIPLLRLKDKIFLFIQGERTPDEKLESLVELLERRLIVSAGPDGTVVVEVQWANARQAYELVQAAVQNFLQTRQVSESAAIAESVSILERYAATLEEEVNGTVAEIQTAQAKRPRRPLLTASTPARTPVAMAAAAALPSLNLPTPQSVELDRLRTALENKRQDVSRLEDIRRQQATEAQSRLATALTIYTEGHPAISTLRQSVESVSSESPQLAAARIEVRNLETAYDLALARLQAERERNEMARRTPMPPARQESTASDAATENRAASNEPAAPAASGTSKTSAPAERPAEAAELAAYSSMVDDTDPTGLRLRLQLNQLSNIQSRIDGAKIELATARAAFKYRYTIVRPAQMPRRPVKPNTLAILVAGLMGSVLLAIGATVAVDLMSGRIFETWQVARQVGIPVLSAVKQP